MGCSHVRVGGIDAIVCGPTQRCKCGRRATRLCDWKIPGKKSGTCDAPLCDICAIVPAPEKDLCPKHAAEIRSLRSLDG
jgi:hypothetical protein